MSTDVRRPFGAEYLQRARSVLIRRLDWVAGAGVLIATMTAQLVFLQGPHPFDPATYFETAVHFPHVALDYFTLRIGLVGLVLVPVGILGPSEAAFYAVPIAMGAVLAGAVYATMLMFRRDRLLAAAAALVTVVNPPFLLNASSIFPDNTATATFAAGFALLVWGSQGLPWRPVAPRPDAAAVLAGVLFGLTYLIREFSPILIPAVALALVLLRYPARRIAFVAAAALATASLELVYGAIRSGNPFLHAEKLLERTNEESAGPGNARLERIQDHLDAPLETFLVFPRLLLSWWSGWLLLLLLALFVAALATTRDRRLAILAGWCFSFWAVMALLGLVSLPSGGLVVNITNVRYWYPVLPSVAMGAFLGLALLGERLGFARSGVRLLATGALAAAVIAPGLVEFDDCASRSLWRNDSRGEWLELRDWFSTPVADRYDALWTDWRTHRLVPAYTSSTFGRKLWDGETDAFRELNSSAVSEAHRPDGVLLIHRDHLWRDVPRPGPSLARLRGEWVPVFAAESGNILVLTPQASAPGAVATAGAWWTRPAAAGDSAEPESCGISPYERPL
jgi:hypothetical protein